MFRAMANESLPLRPPGAAAEAQFLRLCVQCGQCAHVCPHGSVSMTAGTGRARNTPVIVPRKTPCYLCMKCSPQCPSGALDNTVLKSDQVRMGRAAILQNRCHNHTTGVMCWTCYDRCPLRGKAMVLRDGLIPEITDECVGCGVCEYVCPMQAILTVPATVRTKWGKSAK